MLALTSVSCVSSVSSSSRSVSCVSSVSCSPKSASCTATSLFPALPSFSPLQQPCSHASQRRWSSSALHASRRLVIAASSTFPPLQQPCSCASHQRSRSSALHAARSSSPLQPTCSCASQQTSRSSALHASRTPVIAVSSTLSRLRQPCHQRRSSSALHATRKPVTEAEPKVGKEELELDWEDESDEEEEEEVKAGSEVEGLMANWPRGEPLLKKKATQSPGLANSDLWWNFQDNDDGKPGWSAWQKRAPDADAALASAMAEIGQIKLHGDKPSVAEATLARTRKEALKRERLDLEEARKRDLGSLEYYREWATGWEGDSSKEAVQERVEAGIPLGYQIIDLLSSQTRREYLQMQGTDPRIERDPLTMRMRDDQIEQVWGGDPVYPTVNYEQDPDLVIDYRGPNFHDPTPSIIELLKGDGRIVSREKLEEIMAEESAQALEWSSGVDDLLSEAVDIGEKDEEDGDEEVELVEEDEADTLLPGL